MTIGVDCHHIKDQKGIESYVLGLLGCFKKEESVDFILYFQKGDEKTESIPASKNIITTEIKPLIKRSTAVFQHFLLPRQAKRDKVDALFSPSYLLPLFYKGKTALTIHDIIYEVHPEWFSKKGLKNRILTRWVGKKSAKKADIIFTPSEFTKKEIVKYYKITPSKIKVTSAATEIKKISNNKKVKEKFGIKDRFFFFGAALFPRRCVMEMLIAFKRIAREYKDLQLLIVGKNFSGGNIIKIIEETNRELKRKAIVYISDFIGREEVLALFESAHATIYLSLYEGFGLPVLESMACGTPVITGNAGSLTEITRGKCFWVEDPKNIDEIYEKMTLSIDNKELYEKYTNEGTKRAKEFSWQKCANQTIESIRKTINA